MNTSYTYSILRYVHDTISGEFVNVGVAVLCPEENFLQINCRTTYKRISQIFPGFEGDSFRRQMKFIQRKFEELSSQYSGDLPGLTLTCKSISEIAYKILPKDEGSLQWSESGAGLTDDPQTTLDELYNRMVMQYESQPIRTPVQDSEVFRRKFKRSLDRVGVSKHLRTKTVNVDHDQKVFDYALKNGRWHYLEPVSFDLTSAEGIKEKAHKYLGELASVADGLKDSTVHLLLGNPTEESLLPAFNDAIAILKRAPIDKQVVQESDAEQFSAELARQFEEH